MAISREQPMRPAEIDLLDHVDTAENNITQLQEDLEATNAVVGQLSNELGREIVNRTQADTALGTRIDNETQARTQADTALGNRLDTAESDIDTLQTDIAAIPVFEYGSSADNEIVASSNDVINITFTDEKQSTPYVLFSLECIETNTTDVSNCYGIITAMSTTGFSVRVFNLDTVNDASVTVNWLSIGE